MPLVRRCLSLLTFPLAVWSFAVGQAPLRLVNVMPCRLVDTRASSGGGGPFQGTMTFNLPQIAQNGGNHGQCSSFSLANAQAYSLNVTVIPVHTLGFLTIWPTGEPQPLVSLVNSDGRIKANAAIVPAGTNGEVNVFVTDATNVLIDIDAYFDSAADSSALAFFPLPPCRIIDTRNHQDGGTLQHGQERDYLIPGNCGIPSTAAAYSFNVTVLPAPGGLDYLTVWPQGDLQPVVSTLNDGSGTATANAAIVPAGANSKTAFYPNSNNTDLLVDTNGYFAPASSASNPLSLFALTPCRVLDTRNGIGEFTGTIPVGVVGSSCGVPGSSAEAFVFNATVVPDRQTHLSYLTLWPEGETMPVVSTLNAYDGATTSNLAIVPAGSGNDSINAFAGEQGSKYTNLILDISSYFAPVAALDIQTSSLPAAMLNSNYSVTLTAVGGVAPYSWIVSSGSLPPGLGLSSSGTISGMPTSTGTYNFNVQASDSNSPAGMTIAALQIVVVANTGSPAVTTTSLSNGTVNTGYSALLTANGGVTPYAWNVVSGTLPAGLSLNSGTGQISGSPQTAGFSLFTVQVTDSLNHTATAMLSIAVNSGGANGTLNGTYAVSFTGYARGNQLVAVGSITADGNGNITGGETDVYNASSGVEHDTITGGTYSVGSDGLGEIDWLDNNGGAVQLLISVASAEDVRVIGYNIHGSQGTWGAGALRQQNPADFALSALAGNWSFGFEGFDSSLVPEAGDGGYHQDMSGHLTSTTEDINIGGTEATLQFTGTMGAVDTNGRAALQIQFNNHNIQNYAIYAVSANELLGMETDTGQAFLTINSLRQSGTLGDGILNGKAVGRESRQANGNGGNVNEATVLLISFDGQGNYSLTEDDNKGGTLSIQLTGSGSYSVDSTTGRTTISGNGGGGGSICYPVQQNEAFCIEASSGHPGLLFFQPQAAGPFNTASLNGQYTGGSLPQHVSSTDSTIDALFVDGLGNGALTYSQSGPDGTTLNQSGTGTYSVDATGHITINGNGSASAFGYVVGTNRFFAISTDSDPRLLIHVRSSAP